MIPMTEQSLESTRITVVYHGAVIAGKTTNVVYLYKKLAYERNGDLHSELLRGKDRFIFFDSIFPQEIAIQHNAAQVRLQCVPGAIWYRESRQDILLGADAVVFVADSRRERFDANLETLEEMKQVLHQRGESLNEFPWILQYNKRDLPNIGSIQELERDLNHAHVPYIEAVASQGIGVMETFQALLNRLVVSKKEPLG